MSASAKPISCLMKNRGDHARFIANWTAYRARGTKPPPGGFREVSQLMRQHKASPSLMLTSIILSTACVLLLPLLAICRQPQHPRQKSSQSFLPSTRMKVGNRDSQATRLVSADGKPDLCATHPTRQRPWLCTKRSTQGQRASQADSILASSASAHQRTSITTCRAFIWMPQMTTLHEEI